MVAGHDTRSDAVLRSLPAIPLNLKCMTRRRGVFRKCGWVVGAASLFWFGTSSRAAEKLDSPAKVAEWIRSEAASGEVADLEATVDGRELVAPEFRRISGQLLQELLTSDKGVHLHGVRITGAVITDKFDLRNAAIPNDTRLEGCCFKGEVDLSGSHFAKGLALTGCHFERSVSGLAMQVDWSVDLSSTKLFSAGTVPEITLTNGRAVSEKLRALFAAHGVVVGADAVLRATERPAQWVVADSEGRHFTIIQPDPAWFAVYRQTLFVTNLDLSSASIDKKFVAWSAQFNDAVNLDGAKIGGTVWLTDSVFRGKCSLGYARVADELTARNVWFLDAKSPANFYGAKIGGGADFAGARFSGPANFILVSVGGNFDASSAEFTNQQDFQNDTNAPSHYNADFGSLSVQGYALFMDAQFRCARVSFKDATCQRLFLDRVVWPASPGRAGENVSRLRLEGLNYQHIRAINNQAERTPDDSDWHHNHIETWQTLRNVLATNAPYSADVYDRLEDFFQRDGESALADDVGVEKKRQERKRVFWPARWDDFPHGVISWFKSLMLDGLVCYGRRPWQALIPSAFFIALGCWAFRFENMTRESKRREEPTPTQIWEKWPAKQPPPRLVLARWSRSVLKPLRSRSPNYHAFWYSLDQFVPLVDLKASDEWSPDPLHRFAWHYLVVHKIAGAILIPIALAALGGIVK